MEYLYLLLLGGIAYLIWRILDQMPDVVFRLGEIQRDIAELRRQQERGGSNTVGSNAADSSGSSPPPTPR